MIETHLQLVSRYVVLKNQQLKERNNE